MTNYWVIGGAYDANDFTKMAEGCEEQRFGPFASYEDALRKWSDLAWQSVDAGNVHFAIEAEKDIRAA